MEETTLPPLSAALTEDQPVSTAPIMSLRPARPPAVAAPALSTTVPSLGLRIGAAGKGPHTEKDFDAALKAAKSALDGAHKLSKSIDQATAKRKALPDFQSIHKLLGKGKVAEASAKLEQRVSIDPTDREAWRELAFLHKSFDKDLSESLKYLNKALTLDPHHGHLVSEVVDTYRKAGRREEALAELAKLPEGEDLVMAQGELLRELGKPTESLAAYQRAAALPDASLETQKGLARALEHSKQPGKAAEVWKGVLAFHEQAIEEVAANGDKTNGIEEDAGAAAMELARALIKAGDMAGAKAALDAIRVGSVDAKAVAELRLRLKP
ncbi:MAG: hypothetical protein HYZ75_08480 [Elusimicrobia bacterium]|nr:hypothetical protein [Elusimicrobiota bacterium]